MQFFVRRLQCCCLEGHRSACVPTLSQTAPQSIVLLDPPFRHQITMPGLPSPRYHGLGSERRGDAPPDSMSDSAESLLGAEEEKAWSDITARDPGMAQRRASRRRAICNALMSIRSLVDTILLLVIVRLLLERCSQRMSVDIGGDITGFAPRCMFGHGEQSASILLTCSSFASNQVVFSRSHVYARKWLRLLQRGGASQMA